LIKHIVIWTLKDFAEGGSKAENAKKMKAMLEGLQPVIKKIQHIEVGLNFNASEAAYDVALYSEFQDKEALEVYQNHPEHEKVKEFVGKIRLERKVVDYEI
jgi:hypothetical protein